MQCAIGHICILDVLVHLFKQMSLVSFVAVRFQ